MVSAEKTEKRDVRPKVIHRRRLKDEREEWHGIVGHARSQLSKYGK